MTILFLISASANEEFLSSHVVCLKRLIFCRNMQSMLQDGVFGWSGTLGFSRRILSRIT